MSLSRRLAIFLAAVVAIALLPAAPASAGFGTGGGGSGFGSPNTGSGGSPGGGGVSYYCEDNVGKSGGGFLQFTLYAKCAVPPGRWGITQSRFYCPVGFNVLRYWGTKSNPIAGWTMSRVTYDEKGTLASCSGVVSQRGSAQKSLFFASHPSDAAAQGGYGLGSPFYATTIPHPDRGWNTPPFLAGTTVRTSWAWGLFLVYHSTDVPFQRGGLACDAMISRDNPIVKNWNDPTTGKNLRDSILRYYLGLRQGGAPADFAMSQANLSSVASWIDTPANRANYRNFSGSTPGSAQLNDMPCDSGLDFAQPSGSEPVHYGYCATGMYAPGQLYTAPGRDPFVSYKAWPTRTESVQEFGEPTPSWAVHNPGTQAARVTSLAKAQMTTAYGGMSWAYPLNSAGFWGGIDWAFNGKTWAVAAPRNPLAEFAAAVQLGEKANCSYFQAPSANTVKGQAREASGITITVTSPDVGQVGGAIKPMAVQATVGPLQCENSPGRVGDCVRNDTGPAPTLDLLEYDLRVTAPPGYRRCTSAALLGCEFFERQAPSRNGGTGAGAQRSVLELYNATAPGSGFNTSVTVGNGGKAKYVSYTQSQTRICLPNIEGIFAGAGAAYCFDVKATSPPVIGEVPVTVVGAGKTIPVVSGVIRPRTTQPD